MNKVLFQYKEDDATRLIDRFLTGILPSGRYFGYDWVQGSQPANMTLELSHGVTGHTIYFPNEYQVSDAGGQPSLQCGIVVTTLGAIFQTDQLALFNIQPGHVSLPRIDTLVLTYEYIATPGGTPPVYSVVMGAPSATPVAPGVVNPARDVIIGYLYVPAGITDLTQGGIIYTPATQPTFAGFNNPNIAYLNVAQLFTAMQTFNSMGWVQGTNVYTLGTQSAALSTNGNIYYIDNTGDVTYLTKQAAKLCIFIFNNDGFITLQGGSPPLNHAGIFGTDLGDSEIRVNEGDAVIMFCNSSNWEALAHIPRDVARKGSVNRYTQQNQNNSDATATISVLNTALGTNNAGIAINENGNTFIMPDIANNANYKLAYITTKPDGTEIFIKVPELSELITPAWSFSAPAALPVETGYSRIKIPFNAEIKSYNPDGILVRFVHFGGYWHWGGGSFEIDNRVKFDADIATEIATRAAADAALDARLSPIEAAWAPIAFNTAHYTANTGTWNVVNTSAFRYRYKIIGKTVHVNFNLPCTVSAAATSLDLRLPFLDTETPLHQRGVAFFGDTVTGDFPPCQCEIIHSGGFSILRIIPCGVGTGIDFQNATEVCGEITFEKI